jgi:hypothetical protein
MIVISVSTAPLVIIFVTKLDKHIQYLKPAHLANKMGGLPVPTMHY